MNRFNVVVGDWSKDGHGQTEAFVITANLNMKQMQAAYKKGAKKLFDLEAQVEEYGTNWLEPEQYTKLCEAGWQPTDYVKEQSDEELRWYDDGRIRIGADDYLNIWLFIAAQGAALEYSILNEKNSELHIGGYGLFDMDF